MVRHLPAEFLSDMDARSKTFRVGVVAWVAFVAAPWIAIPARAQEPHPEGKATPWQRLETSEETRAFKDRLKEGGAFDAAARAFLLQQALPQLAREENRATVERVRRRMREVLLTEIANEQAFREANRTVMQFMDALARDESADPVTRVNAAMLIGELRGSDNRPWIDAAPPLAALAKDPKVAMAVRVAAMAGLSRYGAAFAANPKAASEAGAAVMAILSEPAADPQAAARPEQEWLAGRAVSLLPMLTAAYPKAVADAVARIVADESRSIDLRVRAAASLGAGVGPQSQIDGGKLVPVIESLAIRMLASDIEAANAKRFDGEYRRFVAGVAGGAGAVPRSGLGGVPMGGPVGAGGPPVIPEQVCRRQAWRLVLLADALAGPDGSKGLAAVSQGADADKAAKLAKVFRDSGMAIDAEPFEDVLASSLDAIKNAGRVPAAPVPAQQPGGQPAQPGEPAKPADAPGASPFDSTNPFN